MSHQISDYPPTLWQRNLQVGISATMLLALTVPGVQAETTTPVAQPAGYHKLAAPLPNLLGATAFTLVVFGFLALKKQLSYTTFIAGLAVGCIVTGLAVLLPDPANTP